MSTDLERELRELFREKAGEAPVAVPAPAAAPQEVLRRGRMRQVATVVGSLVAVSAVVVGSVAGMSSLLRGRDTVGGGEYEVFERTATIEAFTVTSPSDWFLVNQWPRSAATLAAMTASASATCPDDLESVCELPSAVEPTQIPPDGFPMFHLSSRDLGLNALACVDDLPPDVAVLSVAHYSREIPGLSDQFVPWSGATLKQAVGPCGAGSYATFTVNDEPFFAWIGLGEAVSEQDRAVVMDAFESMTVDEAWEPTEPDHITPAYVIAGGTSEAGMPWRLELRPGEPTPELSLEGLGGTSPLAGERATVPAVPIDFCCAVTDGTDAATFLDATFGFITKDATGVELRVAEADEATGEVIEGTILPLPPSLDVFAADVFFISGTGGLSGTVVPVVPGGDTTPTPALEPRTAIVELSGSFEGQTWTARFEGSFADDTACVRVAIDLEPQPAFCPNPPEEPFPGDHPTMHDWLTSAMYLHAGSVPLEVVELRFVGDDDAIVPQHFRCAMGPLGWVEPDVKVCVIVLPPEGSGTLEFLDAEGNAISTAGLAWGSAPATGPSPEPVDPVLGGTYWGVYAWLGSGGAEAEIEAAQQQLAEGAGVPGIPGSLACDGGAAEALKRRLVELAQDGTAADHKVAVYFRTEEEANRFALDAGLLGHEAGPVVAKVTIACLE